MLLLANGFMARRGLEQARAPGAASGDPPWRAKVDNCARQQTEGEMSAATAVRPHASSTRPLSVAIVGAGFGGIAAAIELKRHGIEDIAILEQAPELGGTWFYNSYPGAACDVPSHLYSFSFAQRRDWSRLCSPQAEIHSYLQRGRARARRRASHPVQPHGHGVHVGASSDARWRIETADGERHEADALVLATGQLNQPAYPPIEGIEDFAGHSFHSARWDHDYSLSGKRVAVVGHGRERRAVRSRDRRAGRRA